MTVEDLIAFFYFFYIHISFIVSAGPGSMEYIAVSSAPEPVYGLTNLSIGKSSNEIRSHYIPLALELSTLFLLAYKVIDLSRKILYTWQVVGDGG